MKLYKRDYEQARVHLEKGLANNPNDTDARLYYALYFLATGQLDAAMEQLNLTK
jgi:Tfp pilus assembly protein PilF